MCSWERSNVLLTFQNYWIEPVSWLWMAKETLKMQLANSCILSSQLSLGMQPSTKARSKLLLIFWIKFFRQFWRLPQTQVIHLNNWFTPFWFKALDFSLWLKSLTRPTFQRFWSIFFNFIMEQKIWAAWGVSASLSSCVGTSKVMSKAKPSTKTIRSSKLSWETFGHWLPTKRPRTDWSSSLSNFWGKFTENRIWWNTTH